MVDQGYLRPIGHKINIYLWTEAGVWSIDYSGIAVQEELDGQWLQDTGWHYNENLITSLSDNLAHLSCKDAIFCSDIRGGAILNINDSFYNNKTHEEIIGPTEHGDFPVFQYADINNPNYDTIPPGYWSIVVPTEKAANGDPYYWYNDWVYLLVRYENS